MPEVKVHGKTVKFPYTKKGVAKAKATAKEEKGELKVDKEKMEKMPSKRMGMVSSDGAYLGK